MTGFFTNIENVTVKNNYFRKVLYTGKHSQLVVMSLKPGEEIGTEVHAKVDQFFRVEKGEAKVIAGKTVKKVREDEAFIIPAGTKHNVVNTGKKDLKLYTIYSPANHPDKTVHKNKKKADEYEKSHH
jgi:mannose-6-phosphate isomerase-like protein (cupin superfamily)